MTWPLARVKELGWTFMEEFTSAQATQLDINAAQGADGSLWTDVGLMKNFTRRGVATDECHVLHWHESSRTWHRFDITATFTFAFRSFEGNDSWDATGVLAGAAPVFVEAAASNASAIVVGASPGVAGVGKYNVSVDSGATWVLRNSTDSSVLGPTAICWHSGSLRFVSGLGSGLIETSDDDGTTWIARLGTSAIRAIVSSGSALIALIGLSTVIRSADGITWATIDPGVTVPGGWGSAAYNPELGQFMLAAGDGSVAISSDDGLTFTPLAPFAAIAGAIKLCAFRRMWCVLADVGSKSRLVVSTGGPWFPVAEFGAGARALSASDQRIAVVDSDNHYYMSIAGGL